LEDSVPTNSDGYPIPGWRLEPRLTYYEWTPLWVEEIACEEHARYEVVVRRFYAQLHKAEAVAATAFPDEFSRDSTSRIAYETAGAFERDANVLQQLADSGEWPPNRARALDLLQYEIRFQQGMGKEAARISTGEPHPTLKRLTELRESWNIDSPLATRNIGVGERQLKAQQATIYREFVSELESLRNLWEMR